MQAKPLDNVSFEDAKAKTFDLVGFGNTDGFRLICKASSLSQGWMKSTKAMEIKGVGCLVQVSSEFKDSDGKVSACAEALTFVPGIKIEFDENDMPFLLSIS